MSKETEEIVLFFIVGLFVLNMLNGSSGAASALKVAQINSATSVGYANAASNVAVAALDDFTD